ncbi:MAG TPA: lipid-A-disaccharide synthase [Rhodocyclaceae bacterium]
MFDDMETPKIALVAGEASGDLLAAHLIKALKQRLPNARFYGIGGPKMQAAGFDALWPSEKLAVRGYVEVLRHYREIAGIRRKLLQHLRKEERPDIFIGVDAPDFNLWLERKLKRGGITTMHFVSPSIWAWRGGRIRDIARSVGHMLALFPFEAPLYEKQGIPVTYVGHPLADVIPLDVDHAAARERLGVQEPPGPLIALLPGSRQSELHFLAETYIETGKRLLARFPTAQLLVPLVSRETRNIFEETLWKQGAQDLPFTLLFGHAQDALAAADVALVASGTATLEAALLKCPMVITYRMAPGSWRLTQRMRYQPWVGLPNILSGKFVVPELLQEAATPDNLAQALGNLLADQGVRERMRDVFHEMHRGLKLDTATRAADAVMASLEQR